MPAAATAATAASTRRLVVLLREPRREADPPEAGPRRYRLARVEAARAARRDRFAHLKRSYD